MPFGDEDFRYDMSTFPLMPAPSQDGTPTVRALTTSEAGKWMRLLLGNPQAEDVAVKLTSHSFKATCLSMLAKRGCSFEDRLALGSRLSHQWATHGAHVFA